MYRILIFGMTENPGGVESFLVNYYRHIDREKIQFDFLCNSYEPVAYEDELVSLGSRCFHISARSANYNKYKKELDVVFKEHALEWNAIWVNVCSLANVDYLKKAKEYGIKRRIIHSHNSQNMDSRLRGFLHYWNKRNVGRLATDFWACSDDAAKWFYSGKELESAVVIHNAIDVERLRFNEKKRNELRKKYSWEGKYVIGNIGRLHFQKNQSFMLDVFKLYQEKKPDSVLVLVGQGEDEQILKLKAHEIGIEGKVFFVGVQNDIQAWLSCFDLFLFPSKFEGLSIAALEAQANGVPILASKDVIPKEVEMSKNFIFFDLGVGAEAWKDKIENMERMKREEFSIIKKNFVEKGYDIGSEVKKIEKLLEK